MVGFDVVVDGSVSSGALGRLDAVKVRQLGAFEGGRVGVGSVGCSARVGRSHVARAGS